MKIDCSVNNFMQSMQLKTTAKNSNHQPQSIRFPTDTVSISSTYRDSDQINNINLKLASAPDAKTINIHRSGFDAYYGGRLAFVDRETGNKVGTSLTQHKLYTAEMPDEIGSLEDLRQKRDRMEDQRALYTPLLDSASRERKTISTDINNLLKGNGITLKDNQVDFKVDSKGKISVVGGKGIDKQAIADILNSEPTLGQRMIKNSSTTRLQSWKDDSGGLNSAERVMVDSYLREQTGLGLSDIRDEVGEDKSIWGIDASLDALMMEDSTLVEQIEVYYNRDDLTFEANWSFGNETAADMTNSAKSFLPNKALGTFAEILHGRSEEFEIAVTPEGMAKTIGIKSTVELNEDEKAVAMMQMDGAIARGGGMHEVKQAAERAIEEYKVKNGGDSEDLQAILTVRDGQWTIRVEEGKKLGLQDYFPQKPA